MALLDNVLAPLRNSAAGRYAGQARAWSSPRYRELRTRYYKLDKRERLLLQLAALILFVLFCYNLIYVPIVSYQSGLEDEIMARQHDLTEVRQMAAIYQQVRTELTGLEKNTAPPARDFSLSATINSALNGAVETDKIAGINTLPDKPISEQFTQYGIGLKLTGISLAQLVDVLYHIKSLRVPVVVSNLAIKKHNPDPHSYDVEMTCSVLGKNA